jgi:hypothetical protein
MKAPVFCVCGLVVWMLSQLGSAQVQQKHPLLKIIEDHSLISPKAYNERRTRVDIQGISCEATEFLLASLSPAAESNYRLEYERDFLIEDKRQVCDEGDIPAIDTKFLLAFIDSSNPNELSFRGQIDPDCKKCKPKRGKAISGTLRRLGKDRFQLSFGGDVSANTELETVQ